jgi:23S rRNA (guanosine2251-2'-O)-methyltransferase
LRIPQQGRPGNARPDSRRPNRDNRRGGPSTDTRPGNRPRRGTDPQASRDGAQGGPPRKGPRKSASPIRIKGDLLFGRNAIIESLRGPRKPTRLWIADGVREDERIDTILELARGKEVLVDTVPRNLLDDLTQGANHQGTALETEEFPYADLEDVIEREGTILILDHLHDPQNLGTLIRAADAAGVAGIVLPSDRSVSVTPAVVNASAGAVEHITVALVPNLGRAIEKIEASGRWIIGLDSGDDAVDIFDADLPTPVGLVIGSEGPGLTKNIRERCQVIVSLPMVGQVASLNAATAGSIALFDIVRRERGATTGA